MILIGDAEVEASNCQCGRNCILSLSRDILEMEAVAKMFELEEEILQEVRQQIKCDIDLLIEKMNPVDQDEYTPYCEV